MILEKLFDNKEDFKKIILILMMHHYLQLKILILIELIIIRIRIRRIFREIFFRDLQAEYNQV